MIYWRHHALARFSPGPDRRPVPNAAMDTPHNRPRIVTSGEYPHPLDVEIEELRQRYVVMRDATVLHSDVAAMLRSIELLRLQLHERPCSLCCERCQYC